MTITPTLCDKFTPLVDPLVREIVEDSGRSSGKSTHNEIIAASLMMRSKYNNVWYVMAEYGDVRDKIYSSFISTLQMLGIDHLFTWSLSPLRIRCKRTGAVCYFSGINGKTDDDLTSTKGFTPQNKTLAMLIIDEADRVKHPNHIDGWVSTATRFLLPEAKIVYAYNPPMARNHWAHRYFAVKIRNGATRIYTTWEDVRALLNPRAIADILKFKSDDPEYYRYWYLGEPVNFTGMVYPQFSRDRHVINIFDFLAANPRLHFSEVIFGLDEGTKNDSTCVTVLGILNSGIAVVLDCLEIDPLKTGQASPSETSRKLADFLARTLNHFAFLRNIRRRWIFECAEGGQMLRLQFKEDTDEDTYLVTQKSIMGDVQRVRSMLSEGILLFHVDSHVTTDILISDLENYVFDPKTGDIKKQQRDDTIDSLEYATKLYYNVPMRNEGGGYR